MSGDFAPGVYLRSASLTATYVLGSTLKYHARSWWGYRIDPGHSLCRCLLAFKKHRMKQLPQRDRRRLKRLAWMSRRVRSSRSNCSKCKTVLIVVTAALFRVLLKKTWMRLDHRKQWSFHIQSDCRWHVRFPWTIDTSSTLYENAVSDPSIPD